MSDPRTLTTGRPAAERPSRPGRRLAVLLAVGALLAFQGAWSFMTLPEPYPSVRMPGFGSAPTADGVFAKERLTVTLTFADGTEEEVAAQELMEGFRSTSARPSLERAFWPDIGQAAPSANDPEVRAWLGDRAEALGGDRQPVALSVSHCPVDIDIRTAEPVDSGPCDVRRIDL